tara:strand:+ start:219 stop:1067 length:849 start_codon:yes stop_codon:yes gene_type:complete
MSKKKKKQASSSAVTGAGSDEISLPPLFGAPPLVRQISSPIDTAIDAGSLPKRKLSSSAAGAALITGHTAATLIQGWQRQTTSREVIPFYGNKATHPRACFSNFYAASFPFELPPQLWCSNDLVSPTTPIPCHCSEQAIMLCKAAAMGDKLSFRAIAAATTARQCKALGRDVAPWNQARWDAMVCGIALEVVRQKFRKCRACGIELLKTRDATIVEAAIGDCVWGIGVSTSTIRTDPSYWNVPSNWRGANVLGWALMAIREELRLAQSSRERRRERAREYEW